MELKATGVFPANVTAKGPDDKVDLDQTKAVVEFLFSKGVDGLHVCGTTGEFATLSVDDRKAVAAASLEAANGQGTIMVQVGAVSTADSCELAKHAANNSCALFIRLIMLEIKLLHGIEYSPVNGF